MLLPTMTSKWLFFSFQSRTHPPSMPTVMGPSGMGRVSQSAGQPSTKAHCSSPSSSSQRGATTRVWFLKQRCGESRAACQKPASRRHPLEYLLSFGGGPVSLNDQGFLSDDIAHFQHHIRNRHAKYFDLIHRVNTFCQQAKHRPSIDNLDGREMIAACIMIKILNDLQAAILLVERGLTSQARTLIRVGLEAFFILANICRVDDFRRSFILSDQVACLRLLRAIRDNQSVLLEEVRSHVTPELISQLDQEVKENGITEERVMELARRVNLMNFYDGPYRLFSQDVHTSPRVLEKYGVFDQSGALVSFTWGPQTDDLEAELTIIPRIMILAFALVNEMFDLRLDETLASFDAELRPLENPAEKNSPHS